MNKHLRGFFSARSGRPVMRALRLHASPPPGGFDWHVGTLRGAPFDPDWSHSEVSVQGYNGLVGSTGQHTIQAMSHGVHSRNCVFGVKDEGAGEI
jgi:hypothetical protein